ncbi:MAG: alginate lyase family protein [Bryobacterales bacterium]|nr:alginate lyase family protein [Bryobacterales bacterium]
MSRFLLASLTWLACATAAAAITPEELLGSLDRTQPALRSIATAHELANHFRNRALPVYTLSKPVTPPDTAGGDRALAHRFSSIGIAHQFGPRIDWVFDKTAEAGFAPNNEWTWQLNRHAEWLALSRAYRDTGDEKYAREFVAQMTAWVRDCPMPESAGNVPRSAWRTIETGIRAAQVWPELWFRFLRAPSMTDEALLAFLGAYVDHARHLMAFHTAGNWLAMEGNGLYHTGVLFPEFKDSPTWRKTAAEWIYAELDNQVYPDGVQFELASGYHHVSLNNFLQVYKIARLNKAELPADFLKRLEKMYDFDVYGATPSRRLPGVQDGGYFDVRPALREAAELFPNRADFLWYGSDGAQGQPPPHTGHAFPYAGYFVQRSGWDANARWLWFDGGPFGYGHQHEDKLQILVEAYGKSFLVDPGNYTYEKSKWRSYFIDSFSHNVVLVDGQPQRRRGARNRMDYVVKQPLPHVWATGKDSDYVEATYDEAFGGEVGRGVQHTRAVLFLKPDFWVMLDRLTAVDGKPHTYEPLFHFDGPVQADGLRIVTRNAGEANLTLLARPDAGLSLKIVEGQEEPVQGWLTKTISSVRPAPVGVYRIEAKTAHFLYVMAPTPAGAKDPVRAIEPLDGDPAAARIVFHDGRRYEVRFTPGKPAVWKRQ